MESILQAGVDFARDLGAIYAEVRYQSDIGESIILKNGVPEVSIFEVEKGLSVRVRTKGCLGFASTNTVNRKALEESVRKAIKIAEASAKLQNNISFAEGELGDEKFELTPRVEFDSVDLDSKTQLLMEADKAAEGAAANLQVKSPARIITLDTWITEKEIMTSDGAHVYSKIPRAAVSTLLTVYHQQKGTIQRYFNLGETGGWEVVQSWNLPNLFLDETDSISRILMEAKKPPEGPMDVVLGPEVVGIISHEACGHPGEADRVLGREAAQAGETYLKRDSTGSKVGSKMVNVVDDPTLKGSFGFYKYDEEGVRSRKRILIKEGIVNEFLHNRQTAHIFGTESNGSSRAGAYNREPIVRMANTYLEAGDYTYEELFEGINEGLYIKNFMEWNIDDRRFNQRYVGLEAYEIENGELKSRVRNPILEITTVGLWSSVDAAGDDVEFQAAYCGKSDPMQGIPVWVGGPHTRLRNVRIRGV